MDTHTHTQDSHRTTTITLAAHARRGLIIIIIIYYIIIYIYYTSCITYSMLGRHRGRKGKTECSWCGDECENGSYIEDDYIL